MVGKTTILVYNSVFDFKTLMQIHLARDNVPAGPYSLEELNTMLQSGEVLPTDLMWHEGMDNWQAVGEMTGGQISYSPNADLVIDVPDTKPVVQGRQSVMDSFGANRDYNPALEQKTAPSHLPSWAVKQKQRQDGLLPAHAQSQTPAYASIGARFMATLINMVVFFLTLMPFMMAFVGLNPDPNKINAGNLAERMAYAQTLAEQISPSSALLTFILLMGFLCIQCVMIAKKGQSIGKRVMGIRVVDETTNRLPKMGSLIGLRTLLLFVIYWLASVFPFNLALILLVVNYFLVGKSDKNQGWHDRLAKTVVVKAYDTQLPQKEPNI